MRNMSEHRGRLMAGKLSWPATILQRLGRMVTALPALRFLEDTSGSQVPITFRHWFAQRILGINGTAYWPVHPSSSVAYAKRILIGIETSPGWSPGCYVQGYNGIFVGDYTQIAPGVGLISANHDPNSLDKHLSGPPIRIGRYCLLGMNSVILPGVELGDYTIVGAGSVVTRSFPEGHVVLGGAPARIISKLKKPLSNYTSSRPYVGYIPAAQFEEFARTNLVNVCKERSVRT
jgi:acetyltransferase-like isoleucine patch superfamily enzyme